MSIQFGDVTQLCSLGLAISALGLGVDALMVPRLERVRDETIARASHIVDDNGMRDKVEAALENKHSKSATKIRDNYATLEGIRDDLRARRFFKELSSRLFLKGSIVRVLLLSMAGFAIILTLAVFSAWESVPLGASEVDSAEIHPSTIMTFAETHGMTSWLRMIDFKPQTLALFSILIIAYQTFSLMRYMQKWRKQLGEVMEHDNKAKDLASDLEIHSHLLTQR
ncbi:hypothetical protein [Aliiroseovarius crassostreae]|uniref:hypothetical protein n=1 Tax=Aliiroseovarius crassostreae TaxID=154981 RepID=UPI003C7E15CB